MKVSIESGERAEVIAPGRIGTNAMVSVRTTHADSAVCEVFITDGRCAEVRVMSNEGVMQTVYSRSVDE